MATVRFAEVFCRVSVVLGLMVATSCAGGKNQSTETYEIKPSEEAAGNPNATAAKAVADKSTLAIPGTAADDDEGQLSLNLTSFENLVPAEVAQHIVGAVLTINASDSEFVREIEINPNQEEVTIGGLPSGHYTLSFRAFGLNGEPILGGGGEFNVVPGKNSEATVFVNELEAGTATVNFVWGNSRVEPEGDRSETGSDQVNSKSAGGTSFGLGSFGEGVQESND
jgi:hypothetical protein